MLFLLFDIEAVFLFPSGPVYRSLKLLICGMLLFILAMWVHLRGKKGALEWRGRAGISEPLANLKDGGDDARHVFSV
jgi:hypothetical protein